MLRIVFGELHLRIIADFLLVRVGAVALVLHVALVTEIKAAARLALPPRPCDRRGVSICTFVAVKQGK